MSKSSNINNNKNEVNNINYSELLGEHAICPITLEIYKDPVFIPECGHTLDKSGLINLLQKKCPLCNTIFIGNPSNFKTNWSLASILQLEIIKNQTNINSKMNNNENLDENIKDYDMKQAQDDINNYIIKKMKINLEIILKYIKDLSQKGKSHAELDVSQNDVRVTKLLLEELKKKGFILTEIKENGFMIASKTRLIKISWG